MKSFRHKFEIIKSLSLSDWGKLFHAWILISKINLLLKNSSLQKIQESLQEIEESRNNPGNAIQEAQKLQRIVYFASRLHRSYPTCLVRACTLQRLLVNKGIHSKLCIGINDGGEDIHAHAWIEVMGQAIGEPNDILEDLIILEPKIT